MKNKLNLLVILSCLYFFSATAQSKESIKNKSQIELLQEKRTAIEQEEKALLKKAIEAINSKLNKKLISKEIAELQKKEAAMKHALNIENKMTIIDNKIELLKRNVTIDSNEEQGEEFISLNPFKIYNKKLKYDKRTSGTLVFAFGLNNAIVEGEGFGDTPYKIGGSSFLELGWAWKTRVFKNTNFLRIKYGLSLVYNDLKQKENVFFVEDGNVTRVEEFPFDLKKSKLAVENLVFPVHFEIGPSKKIEKKNYFRYSTRKQFKIGIGGYAGFNIDTRQSLKFKNENGKSEKIINRKDFNTTDFVYGLSSYFSIGEIGLYAKYDLSPIFDNQAVDQNNISLGIRFDLD